MGCIQRHREHVHCAVPMHVLGRMQGRRVPTCWLMMEGIPLHLSITHVTADKVLSVAQEHPVTHSVNVRRCEVSNACVACVLAVVGWPVTQKLRTDLHVLKNVNNGGLVNS